MRKALLIIGFAGLACGSQETSTSPDLGTGETETPAVSAVQPPAVQPPSEAALEETEETAEAAEVTTCLALVQRRQVRRGRAGLSGGGESLSRQHGGGRGAREGGRCDDGRGRRGRRVGRGRQRGGEREGRRLGGRRGDGRRGRERQGSRHAVRRCEAPGK